ncbi:DUF4064 domain-containing protein [Metabacillus litoralis]|uniref:DUF4064 domain-containing protein n=1 Tax=Metabacillus litoralis TaxID=152268 RepID=UPI001CFF2C96|nr:DUF4064 domain-containing protein [Metabacillus litoralis]
MNRTPEVILGLIGIASFILISLLGVVGTWLVYIADDFLSPVKEFIVMILSMDQGGYTDEDVTNVFFPINLTFKMIFLSLGIMAFIQAVLGVIAVIALKGNNHPVFAGVLLLISAVVSGVITYGIFLIAGVFYIIAGIMCFSRKPKGITDSRFVKS